MSVSLALGRYPGTTVVSSFDTTSGTKCVIFPHQFFNANSVSSNSQLPRVSADLPHPRLRALVPQELPSVQMPATNGVTSPPILLPGNYKFGVPIDVYVSPNIHMSTYEWPQAYQRSLVPIDPTRLLCPWDFPGKNTGMGCHFLLQRIFPTQGLNPGLLHCRQILYHLSHHGSN